MLRPAATKNRAGPSSDEAWCACVVRGYPRLLSIIVGYHKSTSSLLTVCHHDRKWPCSLHVEHTLQMWRKEIEKLNSPLHPHLHPLPLSTAFTSTQAGHIASTFSRKAALSESLLQYVVKYAYNDAGLVVKLLSRRRRKIHGGRTSMVCRRGWLEGVEGRGVISVYAGGEAQE